VLAWAAIPVVAGLLPSAYLATVGTRPLPVRLLIGLVFAYAVVLAFWAIGRFTRESDTVERSVDQLAAGPGQAATPVFGGMVSIQGPLALTLVFVAVTVWRTAVLADPWTALRWLPVSVLVNPAAADGGLGLFGPAARPESVGPADPVADRLSPGPEPGPG
jgi:hypothetical protein